jgi:hypothetical protein
MKLQNLTKSLPGRIDVFFCSASFESRCEALARTLNPEDIGRVFICANRENEGLMQSSLNFLKSRFEGRSKVAKLSSKEPVVTLRALQDAIRESSDETPKRFLVDVTTFTHEALLILVGLLHFTLKASDEVLFAYVPAERYADWLSRGISDVRSVLGYPGNLSPRKRIHLVVLVGHEWERAEQLIRAYEPAKVSLGFGKREESINESHFTRNVDNFKRLSQQFPEVESFEFSCNNALLTQDALNKQLLTLDDEFRTVIAPMNTKISTVGVGSFGIFHPEVQLCYAQAAIYNTSEYSTPSEDCYLFGFNELRRSGENALFRH